MKPGEIVPNTDFMFFIFKQSLERHPVGNFIDPV